MAEHLPTEEEMLVKMDELSRVLVRLGSSRAMASEWERAATQSEAAWMAFKALDRLREIRFTPKPYDEGYKAGYEDGQEDA